MKKQFATLLLTALCTAQLWANNVQCNITGFSNNTATVSFSWDNSWRVTAGGQEYMDGVYIFFKYKDDLNPVWRSANLLIGTPAITPISGSYGAFEHSLMRFIANTGPSQGIYGGSMWFRSSANQGQGTLSHSCDYTLYMPGAVNPSVKVFAVEMARVSVGGYSVGDGNTSNSLRDGSTLNTPLAIYSEGPLLLGTAFGNLYDGTTTTGAVSADFPKGYNAFWMMKYELSQQMYVEYLNTLTRGQQDGAIHSAINLAIGNTSVANVFVMVNGFATTYNQGIRCNGTIPASGPVTFYCDLNGNNLPEESADGLNSGVRVTTPLQAFTFLDWAGLSPMTGFQYEKSCRGSLPPVLNELAWGSADNFTGFSVSYPGEAYELYSPLADGPFYTVGAVRNGAFATASSTRKQSGGGFYGAMELSNSLPEVTVGYGFESPTIQTFTGILGDGDVTNGLPSSWPTVCKVQNLSNAFNARVSYFTNTTSALNAAKPCAIRGVIK